MNNENDSKHTVKIFDIDFHAIEDEDYSDIINLPRPTPKNRQPMSLYNRAAQFAPFAGMPLSKDGNVLNEDNLDDEIFDESEGD